MANCKYAYICEKEPQYVRRNAYDIKKYSKYVHPKLLKWVAFLLLWQFFSFRKTNVHIESIFFQNMRAIMHIIDIISENMHREAPLKIDAQNGSFSEDSFFEKAAQVKGSARAALV